MARLKCALGLGLFLAVGCTAAITTESPAPNPSIREETDVLLGDVVHSFLTEMTSVSRKHDEMADSDVGDCIASTIDWHFIWGKPIERLPDTYSMFTSDGNLAIRSAFENFLAPAMACADREGLPLGRARHDYLFTFTNSSETTMSYEELVGGAGGFPEAPTPPEWFRYDRPAHAKTGTLFAIPLEDGRYAGCWVLHTERNGSMCVANSRWIWNDVPDPSDPRLREVLRLTHHFWKGQPDAHWLNDPVPNDFIELGVFPPTPAEKKIVDDGDTFAFRTWDGFTRQVLMQWEWDHDGE